MRLGRTGLDAMVETTPSIDAVSVTGSGAETIGSVLIGTSMLAFPPGITTEAGTGTAFGLLLDRRIVFPLGGAGPCKVIVAVVVWLDCTVPGLSVKLHRRFGVISKDTLPPPT